MRDKVKKEIEKILDECETPNELIERLDNVSTELCESILEDVEGISDLVLFMTFSKLSIGFSEQLNDEATNPVQAIISGVVLESTLLKLNEIYKNSIKNYGKKFDDWDMGGDCKET
jgi:hypothetical protein